MNASNCSILYRRATSLHNSKPRTLPNGSCEARRCTIVALCSLHYLYSVCSFSEHSTHLQIDASFRCKNTMFVDRSEYTKQKFITCPWPRCQHRWCKACDGDASKSCSPSLFGPTHRCQDSIHSLVRQNEWRPCPGCGVLVEKTSGCNHMTVSF